VQRSTSILILRHKKEKKEKVLRGNTITRKENARLKEVATKKQDPDLVHNHVCDA
jgi:hypothetical protein